MEPKGKVAVITGGSRGIGLAIARKFAEGGVKVVIASRNQKSLDEAKKLIGHDAVSIRCDVAVASDVSRLFREVDEKVGDIDILVNNAALFGTFGPVHLIEPEEILSIITANLAGTIFCCREAIRRMSKRKSGVIINFIGRGCHGPADNTACYGTTKIGIMGFNQTLVQETKDMGITILQMSPGIVWTENSGTRQCVPGFENDYEYAKVFLQAVAYKPEESAGKLFDALFLGPLPESGSTISLPMEERIKKVMSGE